MPDQQPSGPDPRPPGDDPGAPGDGPATAGDAATAGGSAGDAGRQPVPRNVESSIDTVVTLEENVTARRSLGQRIGDGAAQFFGTLVFVALNSVLIAGWITWNAVGGTVHFDPYPFALLNLVVATEAVMIGAFVLGKQNRSSWLADRRAHLDLQVNVLTEREITKALQILARLMDHLNVPREDADDELHDLKTETAVEKMAHALHERLPDEYA